MSSDSLRFRANIPPNVKPGDTIRVACGDGTEAEVTTPKDLKPGESFEFVLPSGQLKDPQKLLLKAQAECAWLSGPLGGDINNGRDLIMAILGVAGFAAVTFLGFLAGVLYVTRDANTVTEED